MSTCIICGCEAERDDVVMLGRTVRCVCLRCYARETATERRMPAALRRELLALLAAIEAAAPSSGQAERED
jgi:hypothetical protein